MAKKSNLIKLLFILICFNSFSQDIKTIKFGKITINTNQKYNFRNLAFEDNQVKFINTETNSEFTYFLNSVKLIEDNFGTIIYKNEKEITKNSEPLKTSIDKKLNNKDWIKGKDSQIDDKIIRAEIIFKNNDTLQTHIKVSTNLFDSSLLNELSVNKKINVISGSEKIKYRAEEIKQLRFIDFRNNERIFLENGDNLKEIKYDGKIQWFRIYYTNSTGNVSAIDIFYNTKNDEYINFGGFNRTKKRLKKVTIERPDLIEFIDNMTINDEDLLTLLKNYNNQ